MIRIIIRPRGKTSNVSVLICKGQHSAGPVSQGDLIMSEFNLLRAPGPCAFLLASMFSFQAHAGAAAEDKNSSAINSVPRQNLQVAGLEWLEPLQPRPPRAAVTAVRG